MRYYIVLQNERRGPFTREELTNHAKNKILNPTDKIEDENQKQFFAYDLVDFSSLNLHNQNNNLFNINLMKTNRNIVLFKIVLSVLLIAICLYVINIINYYNSLKYIKENYIKANNGTLVLYTGTSNIANIPNFTTKILETTFNDSELVKIKVSMFNNKYASFAGVLYNKNFSELIRCPIGKNNVNIPITVKAIHQDAFKNCTKLKEIKIPNTVSSIDKGCFYGCKKLEKINIPKHIKTIKYKTFKESGIREITIPDNITRIEEFAFSDCYNLENVIIPQSVTYIGSHAFSNCSKLKIFKCPYGLDITKIFGIKHISCNRDEIFYDFSMDSYDKPQNLKIIRY